MKNKKHIFVGFHVSPEMDSYIRMYAILQNIPMSQILRANTRDWIKNNKFTEEKLIDGVVERIKLDWDKRVFAEKKIVQSEFFSEWQSLLQRQLSIPLSDRIILACRKKYIYTTPAYYENKNKNSPK